MRLVLDSAAEFQKLVPDAVMVGGSAVSAHIGHRQSFDHDHVLTDRFGTDWAASVLRKIDDYYEKTLFSSGSVAAELVQLLGAPAPKDTSTTRALANYKGLDARYHDWTTVVGICQRLAAALIAQGGEP